MDKLVHEVAEAWRITFAPTPPAGVTPLTVIREPVDAVATASPIDVEQVFSGSGEAQDSLDIIWLPPNARGSLEIEKRADAWSLTPVGTPQQFVRASVRSTRVIWTNTRAVIATSAEGLTDAVDAVVRFTATERALRAVESSMAQAWAESDRQRDLERSALWKPWGSRRQLNALTEQASRTRSAHLRVEIAIEQLDPTLAIDSKRLYSELVLQGAHHDRTEMREGPLELVSDHCELANTRMVESRDSITTMVIALLIMAQLLFEIVFFLPQR